MAVLCSYLIYRFPSVLLRYWMIVRWFQLPLLLVVSLLFVTFNMRWISVVRFSYFKTFSASFLITFLSPGIATSTDRHVTFYYDVLWCPVIIITFIIIIIIIILTIKIINKISKTCCFILNGRLSLRIPSVFQCLSGYSNTKLQARCLVFGAAAGVWPADDCNRIQGGRRGHFGRLDNFIVVG